MRHNFDYIERDDNNDDNEALETSNADDDYFDDPEELVEEDESDEPESGEFPPDDAFPERCGWCGKTMEMCNCMNEMDDDFED